MHTTSSTLTFGRPRPGPFWRRAALLAAAALLGGLGACHDDNDEVAPTITTAPADRAVVAPAPATFTVAAAGEPAPALQWQQSTDGGATFADIAGATDASYTTPATGADDDGTRYRVVASNAAGSVTSAAATLSVSVPPSIGTAPVSQSVAAPASATFSVVVAGLPAPTLQWQRSTDGGASYTDIAGANAASYTTPATAAADDGQRFRVVATNTGGSVTSPAATLSVTSQPGATTVIALDFESALPAQVNPGTATLVDVQGFAGLGPNGNQFGGKMLRSATANSVTITLTDLPAHSWLSLEFLFAAIDSLDGTGTFPAGDFLEVKVDGLTVFNESFANSLVTQIQSYVPPAGGELARRVELGFWSAYPESAYDMAIEPRFQRIAHSANSVTITFRMEGSGESIDNESWGVDNLRVIVGND